MLPPVNLWGYAYINGQPAPDGTPITITGDCYNNGQQTISQTTTNYGNGYYDTNIPIDSPTTPQDEGCQPGQTITIKVGEEEIGQFQLPAAGSSLKIDLGEKSNPVPAQVEEPAYTSPGKSNVREILLVALIIVLGITLWTVIHQHHKE